MKAYKIGGSTSLEGEVQISGAKNSALKLMAASLLVPGKVTLDRVPRITDVFLMAQVLQHLGARVEFTPAGSPSTPRASSWTRPPTSS